MRIILKVGTTEYVLANGPTRGVDLHVGPTAIRHNSRVLSQVNQYLRGTYSKAVSRGNLSTGFAFSVSVQKSDLLWAGDYATCYPLSIPRTGEIRIVMYQDNNPNPLIRKLPNAVIESIDCQQTGVSVQITYQIAGGQIT